jgi:predicted thioredoxin/glutaredoxin
VDAGDEIPGTGATARVGEELAALRARLERLERERIEEAARANAAIAAAQDRAYWLDRWQVDLNALMQRRGASEFRAALRAARAAGRLANRARRTLSR